LNPAELAQLEEALGARCEALADLWYVVITEASPVPLDKPEVKPRLQTLAEQSVTQLCQLPLDCGAVRSLGAQWMEFGDVQPAAIVSILEILAQQIGQSFSGDQTIALQPHFIRFASELILGFTNAKSAEVKDVSISAIRKMSHDLKTPINAVTGFSKVILKGIDGPITDFQKEDLTSVYEAGQQLLNMINDLAAVAKHDEARKVLYVDDFDVAALVGDVLTAAQPVLSQQPNTLEVHATGMLGSLPLDFSKARWVILSLLFVLNRFIDHSILRLFATRKLQDSGEWVIFHITGVGLDSEKIESILDKDVQITSSIGFCQELGGQVHFESTGEDSATFVVQFPVAAKAPPAQA